jgi:hypothetical protein
MVSLHTGCKLLRKDLLVSNTEGSVTSLHICIHRHKHIQQVYACFTCSLSESVANAQVWLIALKLEEYKKVWRILSYGIYCHMVCWKSTDISEEHVVSIFMLDSCLVYSLTLRMEATYSSKTSADFQQTMQCCIREDRTLHHHHCKNPIPYIKMFSLVQSIKALTFWHKSCYSIS